MQVLTTMVFIGMAAALALGDRGAGGMDSRAIAGAGEVGPATPEAGMSAGHPTTLDPFADFPSFMERSMAAWEVPGAAVAVIKDGAVILSQGFGFRDVSRGLPVTPRTVFPIGSSTKSFTAMAVGMLADEGKLGLDIPVIECMPDFRLRDEYATMHATARDLLCHRTGLPAYDLLWIYTRMGREELYQRMRHLEPSAGFRDRFQYSNLMYTVAGRLVEQAVGMAFEEFVERRIFEPLGMTRTSFSIAESQRLDDLALPYAVKDGASYEIPFIDVDEIGPAGGIISCVDDMARWILLNLGGGVFNGERLVSESSIVRMQTPHMAIREKAMIDLMQADVYGLGWFLGRYRDCRIVEHSGNVNGFSALVSFMPEEQLGVVVLSNTLNMMAPAVARNIYDRILCLERSDMNARFKHILEDYISSLSCQAPKSDHGESAPRVPSSLPLSAYGRFLLSFDGGKLAGTYGDNAFELGHAGFNEFRIERSALAGRRLYFRIGRDGNPESLSISFEPAVDDIEFSRAKEAPRFP